MNLKTRLEVFKSIMTISFTLQASMGVRQGCAWEAGHCCSHPVLFPDGLVSAQGQEVVESSYFCQGSALQLFPLHIFFFCFFGLRQEESVINHLLFA